MMKKYPPVQIKNGKKYFFRFTLDQRIQHIILAVTVIILVLTGMPLKFSDASWAPYLYSLFGGIHMAPIVHKITGAIMLLLFVYHLVSVTILIMKNHILPLKKEGGIKTGKVVGILLKQPMVPNMKDVKDIWGLMKYLLYFTNTRPEGDEYTWKEKFDYWAPFWGMVIIGLTGLVLWNKVLATQILPGEILNLCLIAHSDEALLAALFLFIWHWYNVHFSTSVFPMGTVFLTGYLPEELMVEEHYEYYVKVMKEAGLEHETLPPHGESRSLVSPEPISDDSDGGLSAAAVRQQIPKQEGGLR
ncbi:MAG: cytochrome b/b6 domain-containing protein [Desulforhopalus sp.]